MFLCETFIQIDASDVAIHLYYIAQEAVDNAIKHGQAAHIVIELTTVNDDIRLTVKDDGVGIGASADEREGMGLRLMRYRASLIGAGFEIGPSPGGGTLITCSLLSLRV